MPTREGFVAVALATYSATEHAEMPKGWIGHAETTTDQGSITTGTDLTTLSLAVTVTAGRLIKIAAFAPILSTVAGDRAVLSIQEGSTVLQQAIVELDSTLAQTAHAVTVLSPSAGSHTYKVSLARGGGSSGTLSTSHASGARQSLLLVEDLGPSS